MKFLLTSLLLLSSTWLTSAEDGYVEVDTENDVANDHLTSDSGMGLGARAAGAGHAPISSTNPSLLDSDSGSSRGARPIPPPYLQLQQVHFDFNFFI